MEFSYKVSEADYLAAWKLRIKTMRSRSVVKTVMFWVFILVCLILFWTIVQKTNHQPLPRPDESEFSTPAPAPTSKSLLMNAGPLVLIAGVWISIVFVWVPRRVRHIYRKDPSMQGEFTIDVTQSAISTRNTAGTTSSAGWNIYESWSEKKDVIILVFRSGAYFILSLSGLGPAQRDELRSILSAALPKK
jgi:hypothetical protein